jgi:hypothetical protein
LRLPLLEVLAAAADTASPQRLLLLVLVRERCSIV